MSQITLIVYSQTGHTLRASKKLTEAFTAAGHTVTVQRLETLGPASPGNSSVTLKAVPQLNGADAVVFCTPVHGGVPAPAMAHCLEQIAPLHGKPAACLVTSFFPAKWGADQTIAAVQSACEKKGAKFLGSASVRWFGFGIAGRCAQAAAELTRLLA